MITHNHNKLITNYILVVGLSLILGGIFLQPNMDLIHGLFTIIQEPGVLITDHFAIAGPGPALLNAGLCLMIALLFLKLSKANLSGITLASTFIYLGFAFFGKTIFNILPIFLGVKLYSMYMQESMKSYIHIAIFATCLAPIVSVNFLGNNLGILVGILSGIFYGFIIVPVGQNALNFHKGYTLYNIGFSAGLCALIATAIIRSFGFELNSVFIISDDYALLILIMLLVYSIGTMILGLCLKEFSIKEYIILLNRPGRAVTDYFLLHHPSVVFFNIGLLGLICTIAALLTGVTLNGPILGAIITNLGFAAFGKNPKNTIPLMIGVALMFVLTNAQPSTGFVLTLIFVTCLAPIPGEFGLIIGIITGMLHYAVVSFSSPWQGAMNLYNNGFASGIVAGFMINIIQSLKKIQ